MRLLLGAGKSGLTSSAFTAPSRPGGKLQAKSSLIGLLGWEYLHIIEKLNYDAVLVRTKHSELCQPIINHPRFMMCHSIDAAVTQTPSHIFYNMWIPKKL